MDLVYSEVESKRFEMNVFRGKGSEINPNEIRKMIINNNIDLLILRLPSLNKFKYHTISKIGFDYLHADSLVYYTSNLTDIQPSKIKNSLEFIIVNKSDESVFDKIIPIIFDNYQNHYFSNPLLNQEKIIEGYIEWAKSYINKDNKRIAWFVKSKGAVAGFATCSFDPESLTCEGVLYGVMPEFSGHGIYSDLIRFTQNYFKDFGYKKMLVSTQLQNYAVQKVWLREGFYLTDSYETYHINSFLNYSIDNIVVKEIIITEEQLSEFANLSGDFNEVHFSDEYAKKLGFKNRIVHGMLLQSFISKIIGVDYPGKGSIFISTRNIFLAPIYLDTKYYIKIHTTSKSSNGIFNLLVKITDQDNQLCLLSYNLVLKK